MRSPISLAGILPAFLLFPLLAPPKPVAADTYDVATLVRIETVAPEDAKVLADLGVDVVGRSGSSYKALLTAPQMEELGKRGLAFEILTREMEEDRRLWREADEAAARLAPTYYYTASKFLTTSPPATSLMKHLLDLKTAHPDVVRLYNLGASASGSYDVIAAQVSKNPDVVEAEPKIRIYGNVHGDEKSGLMVACEALDWILANYPSDPVAKKLVDEAELWFIPMGNPDGNASNSRYNGNSVDLNRNFQGPGATPCDETPCFSEPETKAVRDLTEVANGSHAKKRFTLSISFHAGAICFNSVLNATSTATTDEPIFFSARSGGPYSADCTPLCANPAANGLAKAYQNGATTSGFWYTNGADWYVTHGDTNDWSYNTWSDLDTTVEVTLTKTPSTAQIPTFVAEHRQATINYMMKAFQGISGVMTDASSGAPLDGTVAVTATASTDVTVPHDYKAIFTDPVTGDFHRVLQPGTYTVVCRAPGFPSKSITGVVVAADATTVANCAMSSTSLAASSSSATDACSGSGSGSGNGVVDPGESAVLAVTLSNGGTTAATGVSAVLSTTTPGVTITRATASYPDVSGGGSASSTAPHFAFEVAPSVACGTSIAFTVAATSAQGSWSSPVAVKVGANSSSTLLTDGFESATVPSLPSTWLQADVSGTAGNWTSATASAHPTGITPSGPTKMVIFNSYTATSGSSTRLRRASAIDLSAYVGATASFRMYHESQYPTDPDQVKLQLSTDGGTNWTDAGAAVLRVDGTTGWAQHTVDFSSWAGRSSVIVGLLGISGYGNDVHIDDFAVSGATCAANACTPAAANPKEASPSGHPLRIAEGSGTSLDITFTAGCGSTDHAVYWTTAPAASPIVWSGSACALGTSGSAHFDPGAVASGGLLGFVVVAQNGSKEGSYGIGSQGVERAEAVGVGVCDRPLDLSGSCP
jgi:hypothetical protein